MVVDSVPSPVASPIRPPPGHGRRCGRRIVRGACNSHACTASRTGAVIGSSGGRLTPELPAGIRLRESLAMGRVERRCIIKKRHGPPGGVVGAQCPRRRNRTVWYGVFISHEREVVMRTPLNAASLSPSSHVRACLTFSRAITARQAVFGRASRAGTGRRALWLREAPPVAHRKGHGRRRGSG